MSAQQSRSPRNNDRLVLHAQNTHLYRGARLISDPPIPGLGGAPRGIRLVFCDGVEVDAELLQNDQGELALDVPEYATGAGTTIAEKLWRAMPIGDAGLVIGARAGAAES